MLFRSDGEVFKYKYAVIDGQEYRVAGSVIGQIKTILEKMPNTKYVTVSKQGTGLSTRYIVMNFNEEAAAVQPPTPSSEVVQ